MTDERPCLSNYAVGEEIGHGGMGCVYQAIRHSDGLPVAIKVAAAQTRLNEVSHERFEREIQIIRSLRHHHIARLLDHGIERNTLFFVVELCNGGSLGELLARQGGRLPLRSAAPLMLQCLSGLDYAHSKQVIHRDMKPENILLHQYQGGWIAKIADFGLAKSYALAGSSGMTATGSGGGTARAAGSGASRRIQSLRSVLLHGLRARRDRRRHPRRLLHHRQTTLERRQAASAAEIGQRIVIHSRWHE